MSLSDYRRKRNFDDTPEPRDEESTENGFRFVIQRHRASHLHYDLRLELEGVLKSWAIPKGPSMNPNDKRLAIHTEDHPVAYLHFEGVIPKGNYGAGVMHIWDEGHYKNHNEKERLSNAYAAGKLKITLIGSKLRGIFTLVRSSSKNRENQWLLIKHQDEFATALQYDAENFIDETYLKNKTQDAANLSLNSLVNPMLASPGKTIFNDKNWIYELKYDGYRALANLQHSKITLYTRNGISLNQKFKSIATDLATIEHNAILDGEIVLLNKAGIPQFSALQNYDPLTSEGSLVYYVFDLLHLNGHDTITLPLLDRKQLLKELLPKSNHVFYCEHVEAMGTAIYKKAVDMGMEGIIAKKGNSEYDLNNRSPNWLKFKKFESTEAIICGYTLSKSAGRAFGALILGMINTDGLVYVGTCGSGFSEEQLKHLHNKFELLVRDEPVFKIAKHLKGRTAVWLRPKLLCEVKFAEWTSANVMRHPVFLRLREDKMLDVDAQTESALDQISDSKKVSSEFTLDVDARSLNISHVDKLYWPSLPKTKYDLLDYYIKMAPYILPFLKNRPESLLRHPNGVSHEPFYQKDASDFPSWIEKTHIISKSGEKGIDYALCQDKASLLFLNNLGCIEMHPWHSTIFQLDKPDYAIIDLDPSEENSFEEVIETALVAHDILKSAKIKSFCKTSGASGLHIYVPMGGLYNYEQARDFIKLVCLCIQQRLPTLTTMERSLKKRGSKIYLDYLQNRKGQTIIAAYSLRAKPLATVSTPLNWEEVKTGLKVEQFTIDSVPKRMLKNKDVFLGILEEGIAMGEAIDALNTGF
ncbi:DNA ligase D [Subsaximicrobium wynnwilliamsii]|uniref:DNA ligase (ATP) n=1 Tax=Subsaximicrobium wynnwilliamsii TaxID=291179 RepID=A0A5C6ZI97_9FLAO|nr:DNA ligase D [Subsaximicrobium wynnwilliamsii]TXD81563.1 DNA ligase D [Subsaximicrobium wynnwilliamsii]TXD89925.1 DNA ligase D [Subsaximicrobium wynnwilliamsii]TXE01024.1 DNA ligase D [Subsaximicrobium wynnwilliamsii]